MKNIYSKKGKIIKNIIIFILFIPNLSLAQLNLTLTTDLRSFETPQVTTSTGYEYRPYGSAWIFTGQSGLTKSGSTNAFTWANPNAPLGSQVLFLQNYGYVETVYNFPFTGYYRFRFKAAWREGCCEKPKYIRVAVDDIEAGEVELRSKNYEEYITLPLYLTAGNHTIKLQGGQPTVWGDYTGFVDDFGIQVIDELPYNGTTVPPGSTYAIGSNTYNFTTLNVQGTLVAPQNHDVNINANYIAVTGNGRFQIGQERSPYPRKATITLNGTDNTQYSMGTKFLGAMGSGVIELHGKEKVSWTKLRETVIAGNTVKVVDAVDWEVGDEIVIAPSRAPGRNSTGDEDDSFADEYEKRTITSITNDNKDLMLNSGLTYRHTGVTKPYSGNGQSWTVDMRAEVGLLTRNIKIQGDLASTTSKFGAHVMIMDSANAYFNGVELYRVGQSQKSGRYPFHWHKRQNAAGQYFKNSSVHQSYNRALTIHQTNNVLVENSVFFDHIGHGIFFETGSEEGNKILGNLVIGSKRPLPSEAMSPHDKDGETINMWQNRGPASYWITHPNNTIDGNVAAGTVGTGFWYIFPRWDTGGQGKESQKAPFGSFKNNVSHSTSNGFDIFDELGWTDWVGNVSQFYPHSVHANIGYLSTASYEILNSTWYANRVGVYTGTGQNRYHLDEYGREVYAPNDHLIFKNNVFADNEKAIMLASDNQIQNSIFVEDTGHGNAPTSGQSLVFMYDGAATVSNSHIVGYNTQANSFLDFAHAAFTYGNFRFKDVTKDPNTSNLIFNASGQTNGRGSRNVTIYDEDGSLTGYAGNTLLVNNSFNLLGDEVAPAGWTDMKRSSRRYVNTGLKVHLYEQQFYGWVPKVDVVRTKYGTPTETIYTDPIGRAPTLPFIMNDVDLLYTYQWIYGPGETIYSIMPDTYRMLQFKLANTVQQNDFVIVRFKDMGSLFGLYVDMSSEERVYANQSNLAVTTVYSLSNLRNSTNSAYYIDGSDLYIKAVANGDFAQFFNIKWGLSEIPYTANNVEGLGEMEKEKSLTDTQQLIYPNPASSRLFIKGLAEGEEVQIVDLSGKLIQTTMYNKYLDVSQLKSGMYIVKTKTGSYRFIKE